MDFKNFQYILKVADCQNITRAAEQLFVTQPALSNFISKTEEELGAKIFNRGTSPLTLTQAGEQYVKTARMILSLQESLKRDIDNLNHCREGVITLGLSDMRATCLLPFVLPEFKRLYPNVVIRTTESTSRNVEENVRNGVVDLGIIPLFDYSAEFKSRILYDEELVLVSSEELPHERGAVRSWVSIEAVTGQDFVLLQPGNRIRKAVEVMFLEHGVKPRSVLDSTNNMTAYMIASTGLALAIVPEAVVRMMNPIRIPRVYSIGKTGFHWNVGTIWREDMVLSAAHQQLVRLLTNRYL